MKCTGHTDPVKLIELTQHIIENVVKKSVDKKTKLQSESIVNSLNSTIWTTAKDIFKDALQNQNHQDFLIKNLAEKIYSFDKQFFTNITNTIMTEFYECKMPHETLTKWEYQLVANVRQLYPGRLGDHDNDWREFRESSLPSVVVAIAMNVPVCIAKIDKVNNHSLYYWLCSGSDGPGRRTVHLYYPIIDRVCKWIIQDYEGNFLIKNLFYSEYLYTTTWLRSHAIYTWGHGFRGIEEQGPWVIKKITNHRYRITSHYYEYPICRDEDDSTAMMCDQVPISSTF